MKICPACDRHLFGPEPACPFCGAAQATVAARAEAGALASVALVLTLGAAACGPQVLVPVDDSTSAETTTTASTTTASTTTASTTTASPTSDVTSVGPMTTDPSTTTTAATTEGTDEVDDGSCVFYGGCPSDVADHTECDVFAQDCPVGEKCVPWAPSGEFTEGTRCVPIVDDAGAVGEACTGEAGVDDCGAGLICWVLDWDTNEGVCVALCEGTLREPTCPEPGQVCSISNDEDLTLCLDACDPLLPDCPEGTGCYPTSDFVCFWMYDPGVYGDPCMYLNDCDPGHTCIGSGAFPSCETAGCCTEYCDVTLAEPCPEAELGVVCQPWFEDGMAPPGHEDVGACTLPP